MNEDDGVGLDLLGVQVCSNNCGGTYGSSASVGTRTGSAYFGRQAL